MVYRPPRPGTSPIEPIERWPEAQQLRSRCRPACAYCTNSPRPAGYRLAAAFDLVPDTTGRREHTFMFQQGFDCPKRDDLLDIASSRGLEKATV